MGPLKVNLFAVFFASTLSAAPEMTRFQKLVGYFKMHMFKRCSNTQLHSKHCNETDSTFFRFFGNLPFSKIPFQKPFLKYSALHPKMKRKMTKTCKKNFNVLSTMKTKSTASCRRFFFLTAKQNTHKHPQRLSVNDF